MDDRTKYEAILDVKYAIRLHFLHCRLYKRLRGTLVFISLAAGMSAFALALNVIPGAVGVMGVLVAVCAIIDATGNFAEKSMLHKQWRGELLHLLARADAMDVAAIDAELSRLSVQMDDEIEALRMPAYNDNLRSTGHQPTAKCTLFARLISAIA
jgi:hypothetical protein